MERIIIEDEEWNEFLKDCYGHVKFDLPRKNTTEEYLNWKQEKFNANQEKANRR